VPVRALGFVFLGLVGVTAAAATQAVGALLLLGLLAAPAGAAQRLTARPFRALCLSAGIAVVSMWIGLTIAYAYPSVPPSFGILAVATGSYLLAFLATSGKHLLQEGSRASRRAGRPLAMDGDAA
jgi:zinc/manganese transport system permease protein